MRILHLGKYYSPYHGGMETVLQNQVEGLLKAGVDVRVLVAGNHDLDSQENLGENSAPPNNELIRAGVWGSWQSQPLTLNLYALLRRQLAEFKPDLVQLHVPNPLAVAVWLLLAKTQPMPVLAIWHHADITRQRFGSRLLQPLMEKCRQKAAGIAVSSQALKTNSLELVKVGHKVQVVPFGINDLTTQSVAKNAGRAFLFIGRLVPYKGLNVLIEAMAMAPGCQLDIVGSGPMDKFLAQKIKKLNLSSAIRLHGALAQPELDNLLSQCRALVLPSVDTSETFGLVQLEAMAAGKPIIASDLPTGVSEVNRPGKTGKLVPPGDVEALAAVLAQCNDDDELILGWGHQARQLFLSEYTQDHMSSRMLAWYKTMINSDHCI